MKSRPSTQARAAAPNRLGRALGFWQPRTQDPHQLCGRLRAHLGPRIGRGDGRPPSPTPRRGRRRRRRPRGRWRIGLGGPLREQRGTRRATNPHRTSAAQEYGGRPIPKRGPFGSARRALSVSVSEARARSGVPGEAPPNDTHTDASREADEALQRRSEPTSGSCNRHGVRNDRGSCAPEHVPRRRLDFEAGKPPSFDDPPWRGRPWGAC